MKPTYSHAISFVWVKKWDEALSFYRDVLGLNRVYESDGWVELSLPGLDRTYVALNRWSSPEQAPHNEFFTLGVEDLDAFKRHLESMGVALEGDVVTLRDDRQSLRMLKFFDPDGNVLTAAEAEH